MTVPCILATQASSIFIPCPSVSAKRSSSFFKIRSTFACAALSSGKASPISKANGATSL